MSASYGDEDQAMVGASSNVVPPPNGPNNTPNTMQILQNLAEQLRTYLPRSEETATQVGRLSDHQKDVDSTLEVLANRTVFLKDTVNVLDNRTASMSTAIGNLSTTTSQSQDQIGELARMLGSVRGDTNTALDNLLTALRQELQPLISASRAPLPAPDERIHTPSTPSGSSNATAEPAIPPVLINPEPLSAPTVAVQGLTEQSFNLRLRIGDIPRYNGDRSNDAAPLWVTSTQLWLQKYETLTRTRLSEEQSVLLLSNALDERAAKW